MKNKGITLVALVVSIIIMLILAGVTLNITLGDNGLIGQTKKAVKSYEAASEQETLSLSIMNYNINKKETDKLGEKLSQKDVSNPNWHMIRYKENTYADGWYFVEQGYELPNGSKAKNNYVINYEIGEVIEIEEEYVSMSLGDSVAVKDGLVLNIDTAMMDKKEGERWTKDEIERALGDNVTLHNFEEQDLGIKSGFSEDGFIFDGEDDYISIKSNTVLNDFYNKGFTFEFSGICKGSYRDYDDVNDVLINDECILFSIENYEPEKVSSIAVSSRNTNIFVLIGGSNSIYSEWSDGTYGMNTYIPNSFEQNKPIKFSLVLDLSKTGEGTNVKSKSYTGYKISLYINGKEEKSSYLNIEQWTAFKEKYMGKTDTFDLGRYRNDWPGISFAYQYGKMSLKNLRFYTRPLSAEEIKLNYDTRLAYDEANN